MTVQMWVWGGPRCCIEEKRWEALAPGQGLGGRGGSRSPGRSQVRVWEANQQLLVTDWTCRGEKNWVLHGSWTVSLPAPCNSTHLHIQGPGVVLCARDSSEQAREWVPQRRQPEGKTDIKQTTLGEMAYELQKWAELSALDLSSLRAGACLLFTLEMLVARAMFSPGGWRLPKRGFVSCPATRRLPAPTFLRGQEQRGVCHPEIPISYPPFPELSPLLLGAAGSPAFSQMHLRGVAGPGEDQLPCMAFPCPQPLLPTSRPPPSSSPNGLLSPSCGLTQLLGSGGDCCMGLDGRWAEAEGSHSSSGGA